jgi:DNA-binding MarR family transcriptional regulator
VGQLVDELVALGMFRRVPDPADGRASLVQFTDEGLAQLIAGFDVLDGIERELEAEVGTAAMTRLRADLQRLLEALGRDDPSIASPEG